METFNSFTVLAIAAFPLGFGVPLAAGNDHEALIQLVGQIVLALLAFFGGRKSKK